MIYGAYFTMPGTKGPPCLWRHFPTIPALEKGIEPHTHVTWVVRSANSIRELPSCLEFTSEEETPE